MPGSNKQQGAAQRGLVQPSTGNLREPFERLMDAGLRLNELRSTQELYEFLIEEPTELTGAGRVLLVLESSSGPQLAGARGLRGDDEQALLQAITPWLVEARRTRAVSLRHGPEGADPIDQRSCIVAPLIARRELQGYLYADIDGSCGRFGDADRDLLAMFASQGAAALANVQWSQGLERQLAERTEALLLSNALLEQRANELAIINSIQQGMAGALDFRSIIDLVGDKLRTVFGSDNLAIAWHDAQAGTAHLLYAVQHGQRVHPPPFKTDPDGPRSFEPCAPTSPCWPTAAPRWKPGACARRKGWRRA